VRREAEALAERGDDVTVWALHRDDMPSVAMENGVRVVRIGMPRYRGKSAASYVGSYLRFLAEASARLVAAHGKARFDLVHVHTMPDFMVFAGVIPRLSGAKILLDMHDLMPDLYALKFGLDRNGPLVSALKLTQHMATTLADAVICVHENQYDLLLRDGVPARKLAIVMNSADPKLFPPLPRVPSIDGSGPIRVIYHGTVLHRYGVDVAVRAFAKARLLEPRLVMQIIGGGDFAEDVKSIATNLGLGPQAIDIPGVHRPLTEVAQAIRQAHIGIIPNRDDNEDSVLPTKLLEYIAVGIPAIAVRTRCISRFFDDTQVELVGVEDVDAMARAMVRLAQDRSRREALVKGGRAWETEYGWEVNRRLFFRTVDALCWDKVVAEKQSAKKSEEATATKAEGKAARKDGNRRASNDAPKSLDSRLSTLD
jgi:glycosyltransferase involved in cell wall biosynthesis